MNGEESRQERIDHSRRGRAQGCRASRLALGARLVLCVLVGTGVALACGWSGYENSVRFSFSSDRERERLPPLPFTVSRETTPPQASRDLDGYASQQDEAETEELWQRAGNAFTVGDFGKARILLRDYVARTNDRARANTINDQLDALSAFDAGSSAEHVRRYLAARRAYDLWLNSPPAAQTQATPTPIQEPPTATESATTDEAAPLAESATTVEAVTTVESETTIEAEASGVAASQDVKADDTASVMKNWAEDVEAQLAPLDSDRNLADNAAYLRAAGMLRAGQAGDAAAAFDALAAKFPRSEKREAALYMAGRARLERSKSYAGAEATATSVDPCLEPDCRDEAWRQARASFQRVAHEYPRGRFAADARGWLAYLDWRVGDKASALAVYYRMLSDEQDAGAVREAIASLRLTRGHADEADIERLQRDLEDEPQTALAYAYHEIYNYTRGYYLDVPDSAADNPYDREDGDSTDYEKKWRWEEVHGGWLRARAERRELARVVRFTTRMMNRYPGTATGGAFTLRVAEAGLELGDDKTALSLARRALATEVAGRERAEALWVKGVAERRVGDLASARRTLTQLVAEFPGGEMIEGARRLLAMAAEDAGDLDAALEQYLALGYAADVAYFVDVLMTPDQLAGFVACHAGQPRQDELTYALGVRYLRAGKYAEARAAFNRVRTNRADAAKDDDDSYDSYEGASGDPKGRFSYSLWEEMEDAALDGTGVNAAWVMRDMQTVDDLERLEREVALAVGDEAQAEALYQLASYLFQGSSLKFYNPAAWDGMRAMLIGSLDESSYRAPNEAQTIRLYMQEHESIARAVVIYLDIVKRYPRARAAGDALYTAIVAHQRLSEFNSIWRDMYGAGFHAGERMVTYKDLRRAYPNYRLPRGTNGWEPATRTVNGAPAWDAPPPPKPLTGTERARLKLKRMERRAHKAWRLFGEIADGRARRWSLMLILAAGILCVYRLTRRSRAALIELLARAIRRQTPTIEVLPAPASSFGAHEPYTAEAKARAAARDAWRSLRQVVFDEKGRAALALNFVTHGLLTALVYALMWAWTN
jgi:TolA-binding protein